MELQISKNGCVETVVLPSGSHVKIHHRTDGTFAVGCTDGAAGRAWSPVKVYKTRRGAIGFARWHAELSARAIGLDPK